jgi:hypothetical protein
LIKDLLTKIKISAESEFNDFLEVILEFTIQEIIDLRNLNFRGIQRNRKLFREKLEKCLKLTHFNDKQKLIQGLTDNIANRLIIMENENDKMINTNFDVEKHLNGFFTAIVDIILADNEHLSDLNFESEIKKQFIHFMGKLYEDLKQSYSTGKEGALYYIDYNLQALITCVIGKEALDLLESLETDFLETFADYVFDTYEVEKNKMDVDDQKQVSDDININLSVEKIMEIANLDRQRLEQSNNKIEFSDKYRCTGLFK